MTQTSISYRIISGINKRMVAKKEKGKRKKKNQFLRAVFCMTKLLRKNWRKFKSQRGINRWVFSYLMCSDCQLQGSFFRQREIFYWTFKGICLKLFSFFHGFVLFTITRMFLTWNPIETRYTRHIRSPFLIS